LVAAQGAPLCVIEDVERFCPELEGDVLLDGEVLEQRHVDIPMARVAQEIPPGVPERQATRRNKGVRICDKWSKPGSRIKLRDILVRVGDNVGIGLTGTSARRYSIPEASVVRIRRTVIHTKRCACLPTGNPGELPAPIKRLAIPDPLKNGRSYT